MDNLTERENELLSYIKKLIVMATINGITQDRIIELAKWNNRTMAEQGVSIEWQNEMLHRLETEFGLKYTMLDPDTLLPKEKKEDGG